VPEEKPDKPKPKGELTVYGGGGGVDDSTMTLVGKILGEMSGLTGINAGALATRDELAELVQGHNTPSDLVAKATSFAAARASAVTLGLSAGVAAAPLVCPYALASLMLRSGWHSRCIELIAEAVAGGKWSIVHTAEGEPAPSDDEALDERARLKGFFSNVNGTALGCDIADLVKASTADMGMVGRSGWEISRDPDTGQINGLFHIPGVSLRKATGEHGGWWQIGSLGAAFARRFFKDLGDEARLGSATGEALGAGSIEKPASEIVVLEVSHPASGSSGQALPWWISSMPTIETDIAAAQWNAEFFQAHGIPRKILLFFGVDAGQGQEEVRTYWRTRVRGKTHEPLVMAVNISKEEAGLEVVDLEAKHQEAGFLQLRAANRDEILAIHGVPPVLVGVETPGKLGGKDRESTRKDFKTVKVDPIQALFERIINRVVVQGSMGITRWRIQLGDLDLSDHEATLSRSRETRSQVGVGLRTLNEGRRSLGLDPYPDAVSAANRPFIQTSSGPLFLDAIEKGANPKTAPPAAKTDEQVEGVAEKHVDALLEAVAKRISERSEGRELEIAKSMVGLLSDEPKCRSDPPPPPKRQPPKAKPRPRTWLDWLLGRRR
jgi:hypothetical protein